MMTLMIVITKRNGVKVIMVQSIISIITITMTERKLGREVRGKEVIRRAQTVVIAKQKTKASKTSKQTVVTNACKKTNLAVARAIGL